MGGVLVVAVAVGLLGSPSLAAGDDALRYRVDATVIEEGGRDPLVCWDVETSLPPQCGAGLELDGWRWANAPRVERQGRTTWGEYRLVGTYDGSRFRVQKASSPRPAAPKPDLVEFRTPCDPPPSGWINSDEAKLRTEDFAQLADAARSSPDFAAIWFGGAEGVQLTNVAFTGPVEEHRAALEDLWGGPLCVAEFRHSRAELLEIQSSLTPDLAKRMGIQMTGSWLDEMKNRVVVGVIVPVPEAQARLDRRFGPGTVVLDPWLEKVR